MTVNRKAFNKICISCIAKDRNKTLQQSENFTFPIADWLTAASFVQAFYRLSYSVLLQPLYIRTATFQADIAVIDIDKQMQILVACMFMTYHH